MEKINPKLIDVIRVEYASDLRTSSLYEMMPRFAKVIPQLLQKGELSAAINKLSMDDSEAGDNHEGASGDIYRFERNKDRKFRKNKFGSDNDPTKSFDRRNNKVTCMHCRLLNKELKADFNVYHDPDKCHRKKSAIRLLNGSSDEEEDEYVLEVEGENHRSKNFCNSFSSFQADTLPKQEGAGPGILDCLDSHVKNFISKSNTCLEFPSSTFSDKLTDITDLSNKIRRVRQSAKRLAVRKAPSPSVLAEINGQSLTLVHRINSTPPDTKSSPVV